MEGFDNWYYLRRVLSFVLLDIFGKVWYFDLGIWRNMGLGYEAGKMGTELAVNESKQRAIEEEGEEDNDTVDAKCWVKFRFLGRCLASRGKVNTSVNGRRAQNGNFQKQHYVKLFPVDFCV